MIIDIEKLKKLRKAAGMTQNDISNAANIAQNYYSQIETGKSQPALDTTLAIAKALGTNVNALLVDPGYLDPPQPSTLTEPKKRRRGSRAKEAA